MSLKPKNKGNRTVWLWIAILATVDLMSKDYVFANSISLPRVELGVNSGAAWSIALPTLIITILSCIIVVFLIILYSKKQLTDWSFVFLMAGAIGNLYDRLIFGGVRDWISLGGFPVFNIADILITIGVVILAFHYRQTSRKHRH